MDEPDAILVVDDDPDVLQAARLVLGAVAERVDTERTSADATARLAAQRYECILLDMNFATGARSGSEGLSLLDHIRSQDETVAVIFMTAFGGVSLAVEGLKRGASDFLLKPWRNDALVRAVQEAAQRTRKARSTMSLEDIERGAIAEALALHQGNIAKAAAALGLTRQALYRRLSKHKL